MRTALHQFFRPTRDDFERLWKEALIAYDASALLNIYGYSEDTRSDLIGVIRHYADRSRLPYQFALEYARNRISTIVKQIKNYQNTENDFKKIETVRLQPKMEHPFLSKASLDAFDSIRNELADKRKAIERMITTDEYADALLAAFDGRIGPSPSTAELTQLHSDAATRFAVQTPPGYKDLELKNPPDAYGDYVAWRQLMNIAAREKKDIILVTDDVKEDWWHIESERRIGPRPELLQEFASEISQRIWLYTSESFLKAAKKYDASAVKDEVIIEVGAHLVAQSAAMATGAKLAAPRPEDDQEDDVRLQGLPTGSTKLSVPEKASPAEHSIKQTGDERDEEARNE
jgi:hypothetical protein